MRKNTNESQLNQLYSNSSYLQNYANGLANTWSSVAGAAQQFGMMGWQMTLDGSKKLVEAGKEQAGVIMMAASQAGITAASLGQVKNEQLKIDQSQGRQRVGGQVVAFAGSGLDVSGSPSLLIHETLDSSLREAKYNFLTYASQESQAKQTRVNTVQQAAATEQTARQQANTAVTTGWLKVMQEMTRKNG